MSNLTQLNLESTLGHLPSHDFQVSSTTPGSFVAETFGQQPDLPGVIITHDSQMLGMISRPKFREQMSLPERVELYWQRPIRLLLDFMRIPPLLLAENWRIDEAAQTALNRPKELVFEPIIVVLEDRSLRLLDVHTLLLAQSQVLAQANKIIQQQKSENEHYLEQLREEQEKAREYSHQLIEARQAKSIKTPYTNQSDQVELLKQAQEIAQLNQRFIRVAQLISLEGRKAFQATFQGANSICSNTEKILDIGRAIAKDLEAVNRASKMIGDIIQQVRHLAVQAAVVANQPANQGSGLSQVSFEIGRLVSQTFEVGNQMDQIASRFKVRIHELTDAARGGSTVARAVSQKIERAEMALLELEELVSDKNPNLIPILQEQLRTVDTVTAGSLVQEIERAEEAVLELERLVQQRDSSSYLIQKIENALKSRNRPLS